MNANRTVKKFDDYNSADAHRVSIEKKRENDIILGLYKVKVRRRPSGYFEVIGYDTKKKMTSGGTSDV